MLNTQDFLIRIFHPCHQALTQFSVPKEQTLWPLVPTLWNLLCISTFFLSFCYRAGNLTTPPKRPSSPWPELPSSASLSFPMSLFFFFSLCPPHFSLSTLFFVLLFSILSFLFLFSLSFLLFSFLFFSYEKKNQTEWKIEISQCDVTQLFLYFLRRKYENEKKIQPMKSENSAILPQALNKNLFLRIGKTLSF